MANISLKTRYDVLPFPTGIACPDAHGRLSQIQRFVGPRPESLKAITGWLEANNLTWSSGSAFGDILNVKVTGEEANALLGANYSVYKHMETGEEVVGTPHYTLPDSVQDHISFVYPSTQ